MIDFYKAIEALKDMPISTTARYPETLEAIYMAIDALKEKEDRQNGCQYCRMESKIIGFGKDGEYDLSYDDINDGDLVISNSGHYYLEIFGTGGVDINFCPFCGRKLE